MSVTPTEEYRRIGHEPAAKLLKGIDARVNFGAGETIHTENSYKYRSGQAEAILAVAGFVPEETWIDEQGWFAVCLARVE